MMITIRKKQYNKKLLKKEKSEFSYHFDSFGNYNIKEIGCTLEIAEFDGTPQFNDKNTIYLPFGSTECSFTLRSRKNGDKMSLLNCGSKKISDILTDEKIPVFLRCDIPVLEYMGEIIWLLGVRDNACKHQKIPGKYIKLCVHKENNNA